MDMMRYSCDQWALGERERPLAYPNPNVYTTRWLVPRRMLSTRCRYFPTAVLTLCRVISASYFDLVSTYNACKSTGNLVKQVTVEFIDTHEQRSYLLQESLLGTVGLSRYTDQCQKHGATYGNYLFDACANPHSKHSVLHESKMSRSGSKLSKFLAICRRGAAGVLKFPQSISSISW